MTLSLSLMLQGVWLHKKLPSSHKLLIVSTNTVKLLHCIQIRTIINVLFVWLDTRPVTLASFEFGGLLMSCQLCYEGSEMWDVSGVWEQFWPDVLSGASRN